MKKKGFLYYLNRDKWLYLLLLPSLVYYFLFKYLPIGGLAMAFQDYNMFKGLWNSEWVGFDVFKKIIGSKNFWLSVKNTLVLNMLVLVVSFPLTIILSLILNEIRSVSYKKVVQSILYLPYFISWVIVSGLVKNLFAADGSINALLGQIGIRPISFLGDNGWWMFTYVLSHLWKGLGWGTIIYLAALSGVDESLYEAACLDGATKFQRIIYITLPSIKSVIITMLLLNISSLMSIGIEAPLLLGNDKVFEVSDVISTYTYRLGIERARYSEATAIGLFQSVVNIIILFAADKCAKLMGEEGII